MRLMRETGIQSIVAQNYVTTPDGAAPPNEDLVNQKYFSSEAFFLNDDAF